MDGWAGRQFTGARTGCSVSKMHVHRSAELSLRSTVGLRRVSGGPVSDVWRTVPLPAHVRPASDERTLLTAQALHQSPLHRRPTASWTRPTNPPVTPDSLKLQARPEAAAEARPNR